MTESTRNLRRLVLSAILVASVFATHATVAGAAAAANTDIVSATEYASDADEDPTVEIAFEGGVDAADGGAIGSDDLTVYLNDATADGLLASVQHASGDAELELTLTRDVEPVDELVVGLGPTASAASGTEEPARNVTVDVTTRNLNASAPETAASNAVNVYAGSPLALNAEEGNDKRGLVVERRGGGIVLDGHTGPNSNVLALDTDRLATGPTYRVSYASDPTPVYVNVSALDLRITEGPEDVPADTAVTTGVDAIRGSSGLTGEVLDADGEVVRTVGTSLSGTGTATVNLSAPETWGLDEDETPGNYTVVVTDNQTGTAVESEPFAVGPAVDGTATFQQARVSDHRGDVVEIPIALADADEAGIAIGGVGEVAYVLNATVEDGNDDGEVVLEFNSYTAGANANAGWILRAKDSDDSVRDVNQRGSFSGYGRPSVETLDPADYTMYLRAGSSTASLAADPDDIASLELTARDTLSMNARVLPGGRLADVDDEEDVREFVANGNISDPEGIADGDVVVHVLDATGLEGVFANRTDATNATEAFLNERVPGTLALRSDELFLFNVIQTNAENASPRVLRVNASTLSVVADADNDTYYLLYDTGETAAPVDGDEYLSALTLLGTGNGAVRGNDLAPTGNESVRTDWTVEDREADLDLTNGTHVLVEPDPDQRLSGTTNLAPGTELEVVARTTGERVFRRDATAIVRFERGANRWATTLDVSDIEQGTAFTVRVRAEGVLTEADAATQSVTSASLSFTDQTTTGTAVTIESLTTAAGGFVVLQTSSGTVLGTSAYVPAGQESDLRVSLADALTDSRPLTAVVYRDSDGDDQFDADIDAPSTNAEGAPVTATASVTLARSTETATATETVTPTQTAVTVTQTSTPTTTPTGPGFGVLAALLAVVGGLLLVRRRAR